MKTIDFENEIKIHIEARYPILWLVSFEERRVERIVESLSEQMKFNFWSWSVSRGLYGGEKKKREQMGKEKILSAIEEKITKTENANNIFLLKDIAGYFHSRVLEEVQGPPGRHGGATHVKHRMHTLADIGRDPPGA